MKTYVYVWAYISIYHKEKLWDKIMYYSAKCKTFSFKEILVMF